MSILEILEAHQLNSRHLLCACGDDVSPVDGADWLMDEVYSLHRAHVAQVLEQHEREAKADALEEYADAIQHVDDVIQRGADADDRWCDFQDAEREFNRNDGDQVRDYYSATTHYARYLAAQIRSRS